MKLEEQILLNEIRKGDRQAFKALYLKVYPDLVKFATGYTFDIHLSKDIVQNFFLYLWQNIQKVSIQTSLKAYLYSSVKNRCLNKLRDLKLQDRKNLIYLDAMLRLNPELVKGDDVILNEVRAALNELPSQMKSVFRMKYFEGLKVNEISEEMNISENTVNTHLKRGKKKLRELLHKATL
ncbi:RNA polymerase sigma factor [Xanthovirga aplysinae]|uniref:RNA polymerase sigma factor n=1 Tax=Xanthovirga aplysinae TaxID=2529853 RepID=UPI0012BB7DF9|nr:RNA polymerase sigma-70 factor [Xanthovirga aplysinae]MTI30322.1 RNA polymerase sigma-70 factor [Xanthovirga aplysinae]